MYVLDSVVAIILGFTVLALLLTLRRPIWQVLLASSVIMGVTGLGPFTFIETLIRTSSSTIAIDLTLITFLIATLVSIYRSSGLLEGLSLELVRLFRRPKLILTFVPAILGLLPVAGGALMSAPIVDSVGSHIGLRRDLKLFINVWFRHVIFLIYPISTIIVATAALANIDLWSLVIAEIPVFIAMITSGYIIGFRGVSEAGIMVSSRANLGSLLKTFSPILTAIALAITLRPLIDGKLPIPITRLSMLIGVSAAIMLLTIISGEGVRVITKALSSRVTYELTIAAFSAVLLRNTFMSINGPKALSTIIPMGDGLESVVLYVAIPTILSLATGSPMTGSIISVSIFKPLMNIGLRDVALIYASAMLGYLASPAHLCYIYSAEYFRIPMSASYKEMFLATIATLGVAIATYFMMPA